MYIIINLYNCEKMKIEKFIIKRDPRKSPLFHFSFIFIFFCDMFIACPLKKYYSLKPIFTNHT